MLSPLILEFFSNKTGVFGKGMGVRHKAMGFSQMEQVLGKKQKNVCYHHNFGIFFKKTGVFGKGMGVRQKAMGFSQMEHVLG